MKYQQLENLEAGWKWLYLVNKHKDGVNITRYVDKSEIRTAIDQLFLIEHQPTQVIDWVEEHMSIEIDIKLKQAIRAKRKRYFDAENEHTRKKSIDLDFRVWEKLSQKSQELDATLSDTIEYLLSDENRTASSAKKVDELKDVLKKDLSSLLDF